MQQQFNPPWPCEVVGGEAQGQSWKGPLGRAMALLAWKEHSDQNVTFLVIFDEGGQLWEVEHPFVRGQANKTWGRNAIQRPGGSNVALG